MPRNLEMSHRGERVQCRKGVLEMGDSPWVDLVIVSYQTRKLLELCLKSIIHYTDLPYHVTIVDNGSTDGTRRLALEYPRFTWIWNRKNIGYGRACNQGAAAGRGRHIIFMNSDTEVTKAWLSPLIERLENDSKIALVGPRLVSPEGRLVGVGVVGDAKSPSIRGWMEPDEPTRYATSTDCLSLCGACIGMKRGLIPFIGLFDPVFFHYFEETDLCYRARHLGYRVVYEPASRVIHQVSASCTDTRRLKEYYLRSKRLFEEKWKTIWGGVEHGEENDRLGNDRGERCLPIS